MTYYLRKAVGGMRNAPFVHAVAAITIAVALLLSGIVGALALQGRALLSSWGLRAELTLYLAPATTAEQGAEVARQAALMAGGQAHYVAPGEALARLSESLGESGKGLAELAENPLPPSVEVVPGSELSADSVETLAARLRGLPGVAEVDYGRAWIERVTGLSRAAAVVGLTLVPLILLGAAVLAGSVVRLAIHARAAEIEIMRLVGATDAFVRAPFLMEGLLAGLAGGILGAVGLYTIAQRVGPTLSAALPLPPELQPMAMAGPLPLLGVALAGSLLGFVASAVSVGRHLR